MSMINFVSHCDGKELNALQLTQQHVIGIFQYPLHTNPHNFQFGKYNTCPLTSKAVDAIAHNLIRNGIKTHSSDMLVPVLLKRSWIQPPQQPITEFNPLTPIDEYPPLEITPFAKMLSHANMLHILNGHHRYQALQRAEMMCTEGMSRLDEQIERLEVKIQQDTLNASLGLELEVLKEDHACLKTYLMSYDNKWLVIVYDQGKLYSSLVTLCMVFTESLLYL